MYAAAVAVVLLFSSIPLSVSTPAGINYGQVANNLPSPSTAASLVHSLGIFRVKLYDSDPGALRAFAGTGVELTVGIPDRCIPKFARDPSQALVWVKYNVLPYLPGTKIVCVTVGNEVLTGNDTSVFPCLVPAMQAVRSALASLNLDRQIKVTTPHSLAIVSDSYPPSSALFNPNIQPHLLKTLDFLIETQSPFLINAYPYFAYKKEPKGVDLEYVLMEEKAAGVVDPVTGLKYENMLFAQVDAVNAAIEKAVGKEKGKCVVVRVSETGWPSRGDEDEAGATVENAGKYNGNLMKMVEEKKGTPMRPDTPLEVFVFALFNENQKPGPTSERNYGLFKPDGTLMYSLGIGLGGNASTSGGSGGGHGGGSGGGGDGGLGSPEGGGGSSPNVDFYDYSGVSRTVSSRIVFGLISAVHLVGCFWLLR